MAACPPALKEIASHERNKRYSDERHIFEPINAHRHFANYKSATDTQP
jgi:hypothetical protein